MKRREPSMSAVRRIAAQAPENLAGEIARLRAERDGLRAALAAKLEAHVLALDLRAAAAVVVRRPVRLSSGEAAEAAAELATRLRQRHGWEGAILLLDAGTEVEALDEPRAMALFDALKRRLGG